MAVLKKNIVAICGSTRTTSANLTLIKAIADLASEKFNILVFDKLADIPHFNTDLDGEDPPEEVSSFRRLLQQADGILICTPEYAMGVPGSLKNAIDWTVSSCEFSKKPVALITASSLGHKGHASLMETLKIIEADIPEESQLVISHVKAKLNENGIKDPETTAHVLLVMDSLWSVIRKVHATTH